MTNPSLPFATSAEAAARLEACRLFEGPPREFWPLFAKTCAELASAQGTRVLVRAAGEWRIAAGWPGAREFPAASSGAAFLALAERALAEGIAAAPRATEHLCGVVLVALATGEANEGCLLAVALTNDDRNSLAAVGGVLRLAADTPLLYQRQRLLEKTRREVQHFAQALEVLAATNAHTRYLAVAMALVNELASRLQCTRVALGWSDGTYIRVQAISGTDRFEKRMAAVQKLEAAMEEARDQDEEIIWPAPPETTALTRDHAAYAESEHVPHLLSVPVRIEGEPRGVLTLERATVFGEDDALALRVVADQVARRLDDLRKLDRWFGARWARAWREWFAGFLGPKQTWLKVGALAGVLLLAVATLVPFSYRVNATFIMRADPAQLLPAPFDGYLAEVAVRPGDKVAKGDLLARLDPSDLLVQQAAALAERQRYASEAEKAEADRELSNLRVARAQEAESAARLALVQYRLERAEIRAPFKGVVIEGDLREKIGAPVHTGDILIKVSQPEGFYIEMRVPERDIDLIKDSRRAEIAFVTQPEETFAVQIERIEPSAVADKEGNVFVVRGRLDARAERFRPGMSGVAKIETGDRSLLWIATHRLVDFLRLKFWW